MLAKDELLMAQIKGVDIVVTIGLGSPLCHASLFLTQVTYLCYTGGMPVVCLYISLRFLKNGAVT